MEEFPEAEIDYLTKKSYAPLIEHHPAVEKVITYNDSKSFLGAVSRIRKNRYDLFVDLQANAQSAILRAGLLSAKKVRYPKRRFARELIVRRPQLKLKVDHTVNAYFTALRKLGMNVTPSPPVLALPPEYSSFADDFMKKSFPDECKVFVVLCPGARHYEKKWPRFGDVAESLLEKSEIGLLVISSSDDNLPDDLRIDHPRLIPIRDYELLKIGALMSGCSASITNDSGLMHLSCAVQTPVAAIFGPTNPRLGFSPVYPGSIMICDDVFCSPCSVHGKKRCSQSVKHCFNEISPERVVESLFKII
ncbi:MAG: glycosyltransferase family 9 protein [candidate division Zixibacteria bacterium]